MNFQETLALAELESGGSGFAGAGTCKVKRTLPVHTFHDAIFHLRVCLRLAP